MKFNHIKVDKNIVINFLFLSLSPIVSFFYSLYLIIRKKKFSPILCSIPFSLILISMPWASDTLSNFKTYIYTNGFSDGSFYINIAYFLKVFFNLDFYYFYFFTLLIICYFKFYMISEYSKNINLNYYFFICVLLLSFSYRDVADLNRTYLALTIVIFSFYLFVFKNKIIIPVILSIVAFYIHSFSLLVMFIFFSSFMLRTVKIKYLFLCLLLSYESFSILTYLINSSSYISEYSYYITGERWGHMKLLPGNIIMRFSDISVMFGFLYIFRGYRKELLYRTLYLISVFAIFFLMYRTFYERTVLLFYLFLPIFLFVDCKVSHGYKIVLLILLLFRFVFYNIYTHGYIFISGIDDLNYYDFYFSNISKLLYCPSLFYVNNYSLIDAEIIKNYF